MLHHRNDPTEAYRRIDFDARVSGADSRQLVDLCLEQVIGSVARAVHAEERGGEKPSDHVPVTVTVTAAA